MPIFSREQFAQRLCAIKEETGLSLKGMAAKAGIKKPQTMRNYLEGTALPNVETVAAVVLNFGIHPMWLLTGEGEMWAQEDGARKPGTAATTYRGTAAQKGEQQPQTDLGRELEDVRKEFERVGAPPEIVQQAMLEAIKSRAAPREDDPDEDPPDRSSGTGKDVRGPRRAKGLGS